MLRVTPFHSRTAALCQAQNWRRWAGYIVASSYELVHEREYWAIRSAAALIDVSPLFKYSVRGRDAARFLDRVLPRDVVKCDVGRVMYTPWCDGAGKVIDDGTCARLDEETFRLTSGDPNLRWLTDNALGFDVAIDDVSDSIAALSLQGPAAREILKQVSDADLDLLRFFRITSARIDGIAVEISRTGYTGDLGYEIWLDPSDAERIWDTLVEAGTPYGLMPVGMLAMDVARIEAGLLLIAVDYISSLRAIIEDQKSSPFELGLGWTVKLEKDFFVGRDALREEQHRGHAWQLRGLDVEWESLEKAYAPVGLPPLLPTSAWRTSVPVYANGEQVGYATSGCWSPVLKKYVALAHLQAPFAEPTAELEMEVTVEHHRRRASATVVKTPFFDPERKRA